MQPMWRQLTSSRAVPAYRCGTMSSAAVLVQTLNECEPQLQEGGFITFFLARNALRDEPNHARDDRSISAAAR